jgi:hypothetical protein
MWLPLAAGPRPDRRPLHPELEDQGNSRLLISTASMATTMAPRSGRKMY